MDLKLSDYLVYMHFSVHASALVLYAAPYDLPHFYYYSDSMLKNPAQSVNFRSHPSSLVGLLVCSTAAIDLQIMFFKRYLIFLYLYFLYFPQI